MVIKLYFSPLRVYQNYWKAYGATIDYCIGCASLTVRWTQCQHTSSADLVSAERGYYSVCTEYIDRILISCPLSCFFGGQSCSS